METDLSLDDDETYIQTQQILLAAAHHDISALRPLLQNSSVNVQDPETCYTPLHMAIAACADPDDPQDNSGVSDEENHGDLNASEDPRSEELSSGVEMIKFLLQNGAIWNELDVNDETPGCLAWRLGLKSLYEIVVDAGVRAELLLNRLDDFELLAGEDSEEEEDDVVGPNGDGDVDGITAEKDTANKDFPVQTTQVSEADKSEPQMTGDASDPTNNTTYLNSTLQFQNDRLLDSSRQGVMMSWETSIMKRSVELLLPATSTQATSPISVLNIGHGMGIIDNLIRDKRPATHHIIEAHPDVLSKMRQDGWFDRESEGVTIHQGRWQDVLPKLVSEDVTFDAIYFDTFAEDYKAFRQFFSEYVVTLLKPEGKWSFFHGLGADRRVAYDVYTKVVEMDLFEAGFDVEWEDLEVPDLQKEGEWEGVLRSYWSLDVYRLPVCAFVV